MPSAATRSRKDGVPWRSLDRDRHAKQRPGDVRGHQRSLRAVGLTQRPVGIHGLERP